MGRRNSSLLDEIERGALDDRESLAATLRKCMILGGQAKSAELRTWASRELNGYGPNDELPKWRTVAAPIHVDGISGRYRVTGQQISVMDLPEFAQDDLKEEVDLRGGVGELEAMLRQADEGAVKLSPSGASLLVKYMNGTSNDPYRTVERIYWTVSTIAIHGVLDRIRTALTELVAEIRHGMPGDAATPSEALATQALNVAVHGKGNRVIVAQAGGEATSHAGQEPEPEPPHRKAWAWVVGFVALLAAIIAALYAVLQYYLGE